MCAYGYSVIYHITYLVLWRKNTKFIDLSTLTLGGYLNILFTQNYDTPWTWVGVNSGRWWWTGRPGVLRFMGLQRVGHDWATELNWTDGSLKMNWGVASFTDISTLLGGRLVQFLDMLNHNSSRFFRVSIYRNAKVENDNQGMAWWWLIPEVRWEWQTKTTRLIFCPRGS